MRESLAALVASSVDYAGLFPPAAQSMEAAVASYDLYLRDPARTMLARFVVPVARLREFDDLAAELLPRGAEGEPWRLSGLVGIDAAADIDLALKFNCRHWSGSESGHAVIDALEMKVSTLAEVQSAMSMMPRQITAYFEIPLDPDPAPLVRAIASAGGRVKARTGGVTPDAFPESRAVARFMLACRDAAVPFKLTAGLHHPLRAIRPLTYASDAPVGEMFGFLGMFIAAALAAHGADPATVRRAIELSDVSELRFADDHMQAFGVTVTTDEIRTAREQFIISFGSCSFREPADELAELQLTS